MRRYLSLRIAILLMVVGTVGLPVSADETSALPMLDHLVFTEILPGTTESASEEFIELYNPTEDIIQLNGYSIQYQSASGGEWRTKLTFDTDSTIEPRGYLLLSTYLEDLHDESFASGLAQSGGALRIVELVEEHDEFIETVHDLIGWGDPQSYEAQSIVAPKKGESLKRYFTEDGEVVDTDDNSFDLFLSESPYPQSSRSEAAEEDRPTEEEVIEESVPVEYLAVEITELFIDPKSPLSDAEDEFVELHNPHNVSVNLDGYVLRSGNLLNYDYVFGNVVLSPGEYKAFYSRDTNLTLANSGGRAVLYQPDGIVASQVPAYENAKAGQSWGIIDGAWQYSSMVTPNQANRLPAVVNEIDGSVRSAANFRRQSYPKIQISELFIDPGSPLKDADDEFVELYNPNDFTVQLEGYQIQTGMTYRYKYTLPRLSIKPGEYLVFHSADSNLTLSNKEGRARIVDPNGTELSATEPYQKAKVDTAWMLLNGEWHYTLSPTPSARNVLKSLSDNANGEVLGASTSTLSEEDLVQKALSQPAMIGSSAFENMWVWAVFLASVGYLLYEFRYDVRNRWTLYQQKLADDNN